MSNHIYHFLSPLLQPDCELMPSYIGKSREEIISSHPENQIVATNLVANLIIEIRLNDATLTCAFDNDICIDAKLFRDDNNVDIKTL